MLSLEHISINFGDRSLFEDITVTIGPHDRIGLVGPNGSGKSTLLKIIAGIHIPDNGNIRKPHFIIIGYLPQDAVSTFGLTLYQEAENAFEGIIEVRKKLNETQDLLNTLAPAGEEYVDTIEIIGELQHKLEDLDAYRMKSKIERVLTGLGFSVGDFQRMTDEFSGGWQMRIALAKLLLKEPNILLLDEPTNHLDIETLQWLENYLHAYNGALIIVSHDRTFIDSLTTRIFALDHGRFEMYSGNYSFYETEYRTRKELLLNQFRNQQRHVAHTQKFIDRFRYKETKARQVQSRIKQLEKMDIIEIENDNEEIHFRFSQSQPSGRTVLELKNINKSYGPLKIFERLNYRLERSDHVAIVGINGAGKSTLSRILAGVENIDFGERIAGHNVVSSYFAQDQADELDLSKDVLQTAAEVAQGESNTQLRTLLGSFLFHGDDVLKRVSVLSGGEKSRLALVRMLLLQANFLILDEPTNHLDMKSKSILQEALLNFDGTYVIVSHDRAFLDPIVNKVLEVNSGSLRLYLGNLSEYLEKKKKEKEGHSQVIGAVKEINTAENAGSWRTQRENKKNIAREIKTIKKRIEETEVEIQDLETEKRNIESQLANPELYKDGERVKSVSLEYKNIQLQLERSYTCWTSLIHQLEQTEEEAG